MRNAFFGIWLVSLLAFGCAGDEGGSDRTGGGSQGPAGSVGDGDGDGSGAGPGTDDFGNRNPTPGMTGGMAGDAGMGDVVMMDDGCGATSYEAEEVVIEEMFEVEEEVTTVEPVAIYLMLDQSGSMVLLWPGAVASVTQFVQDPMSAGLDVGIQYFPGFGECNGTGYDTPEVPIAALPGNTQPIIDNLGLHAPFGIGTPTEGALRGATDYCLGYQASNPNEKCVAVLITDGAPSGCNETHDALVGIATDARAAGVLTYAVGFQGADFNLLNRIAMEGGGEDCDPGPNYACDVTAGADQLVIALNKIREEVTTVVTRVETVTKVVETPVECEWVIPESESAAQFDKNAVNVELSSDSGDTTLGKVDTVDACKLNGWHFDDNDAPTKIIACPETCDAIESQTGTAIDILLGCKTVVLE